MTQPTFKTLSILIPAYNEAKTIIAVLDLVKNAKLDLHKEMIIVDDGSTDNTADLAQQWCKRQLNVQGLSTKVVKKVNGGKGSAIREAIRHSTGELAIIQDADMEYDPNDYLACLAPIRAGLTEVVYGSRYLSNKNAYSYFIYLYGGRMVSIFTNLLYGSKLTDEPTCYKTFRGDLLRGVSFEGDHFEWEPEITAKLLRLGHRIVEVPISYFPRHFEDGKKIGMKDGLQALWTLLRWRFANLSQFNPYRAQNRR